MPHIQLEYSANVLTLNFKALFTEIHSALNDIVGIRLGNMKSRAICHNEYYIAEGDTNAAFVHCDIRFTSGRSIEIKQQFGQRCLEILQKHYLDQDKSLDLQITVYISDLERESYFKYPAGTLTPITN